MTLTPLVTHTYHVFLASPGDVSAERQAVRRFFDDYNRHTAHIWNAWFEVVDWENYSTIGVGRPQELITRQTLERFRDSLALVIGIMAQRFGSPSGKAESGTEEEFTREERNAKIVLSTVYQKLIVDREIARLRITPIRQCKI
jgi:hypothetical protein